MGGTLILRTLGKGDELGPFIPQIKRPSSGDSTRRDCVYAQGMLYPVGRPAKQSDEGTVTLPPFQTLYFEDLRVGMTEAYAKTVKSSDVIGFAEITGDRNPIHLSEHFAAKTPFKGRIAHGLYTAGLISAVIGTRLPGPGAIYISQVLSFKAPVRIGDTVQACVEVVEVTAHGYRAKLACKCTVGSTVVLEGEAIVKVPPRPHA